MLLYVYKMGLTKSEGCTFILMVVFVYAGGVLSSAFLPNKLGLLRCYRGKRRWQTIRRNCDIFASHSKSISIWHQHKNMTHSKSNGFWHQPKNTIESSLHSPPPDHILELIREQTYRGGFEPARDFRQCAKIVHGSIPLDLVGTLAINCPGRIRVGARMLGHWFDGDGYLVTLSLDGNNNEASVHGRYVRTSRFKAQEDKNIEKAEDKNVEPPLAFSGAWTKAGMGKWWENFIRIPENPANTATMWLPPLQLSSDKLRSPRLFALCEGGHPIEIDPISLEVLNDEQPFRSSPKSPKQKKAASYFSAHFSQDPNTNNIYNHGYILDPSPFSTPRINLMKLSPEGILLHQKQSKMPYNTFVHDATISQNFYLYFVMPYTVPSGIELIPFILGKEPLGGGMRWRGAPSTGNEGHGDGLKSYLHVHSKNNLWLNWKIEMPDPVSVYHIVDAFEEKRDQELRLKVRLAELFSDPPADRTNLEKQFANQYAVPSGERLHAKLREYTFLLCANGSGKLLESKDISSGRSSSEYRVGSFACEYPITNQVGTENRLRYAWINTLSPPKINLDGDEKLSDWFDGVQKVDLNCGELSSQIISFGEGTYCGPPYFVPKRRLLGYSSTEHEEDDGYIVTLLYKSERHSSDVAILNSKTMDILCIMELDFHIPYSFHGEFLPDFVIPKTTLRGAN